MALFHFGKKKEEKKASACCCAETTAEGAAGCCGSGSEPGTGAAAGCCGGSAPGAEESASCPCGSSENGIRSLQVLGAGCRSCHELYENVKAAAGSMGLSAGVEYITDMEKIMAYGVMSMPAIVVNGQVVSMGKVLKAAEVEKLLHRLGY